MLKDIQHQNQIVSAARLKALVKSRHVNAAAVRPLRIQQRFRKLHSFHVAKFRKRSEKKSVTAANVQNPCVVFFSQMPEQNSQNRRFSRTPPPVPLVQFPVSSPVFRIQRAPFYTMRRTAALSTYASSAIRNFSPLVHTIQLAVHYKSF